MEAPDFELSSNNRTLQKHKATYTQIIAFGFLVDVYKRQLLSRFCISSGGIPHFGDI